MSLADILIKNGFEPRDAEQTGHASWFDGHGYSVMIINTKHRQLYYTRCKRYTEPVDADKMEAWIKENCNDSKTIEVSSPASNQ